ncbi:MAG: SDR family oxidoreductase [Desulfobacterales bacterium]|nr:SDR family oxidoreductase [Desulfobacterales bacterium]MCP4158493.1 SDR family oxidoreductase [Deltaproteobacteria bacterium]
MSDNMLKGKRILITHANQFMGPVLCDVFKERGAEVIRDFSSLNNAEETEKVINAAGEIDVLVANLSVTAPSTEASKVTDDEWKNTFATIVDPLPRLFRAVLPQMIDRSYGKILVVGSASALRGINRASTYSAARGAQLGYVQAVGVEVAKHNIQVNAIAQNFVDNPTYFPPEVQANEQFKERLKREVPLGRLVEAREDADFAAYLCSDMANCFVGQIFPICGGWVTR